jgi:hypothetical protein
VALPENLQALREQLMAKNAKLQDAVKMVADKKDSEYHDLVAPDLVAMQTEIYVGLLLMRDAAIDSSRSAIAERYVLDAMREFELHYAIVTSGDDKLIGNRRDIIDY